MLRELTPPSASPHSHALNALERYRPIVDDWRAFADALARPIPTCIWANPTRIDAHGLAALLEAENLEATPLAWQRGAFRLRTGVKPGQHWWFCAGLAHAQEEVSQVPATLLELHPGHRVLDMCAAPGGKTAQIAFALGNRGTVIANDFFTDRIKALQGNLDRLGAINVTTTCSDAANWSAAGGQFDRILVDAPCSGEGTLRRNGKVAVRIGREISDRFASRQRALLRKAVQRCRPGSRILYSTCTFAPEENELVVEAILREYDGRVRLLPASVPRLVAGSGITSWAGRPLDPELEHCIRLWPHHNDSGGFFIAVLEKDAQARIEPEPVPLDLKQEPDPSWLADLSERYGLPERLWQDLQVHRQTRRGLHLTAADHAPPATPPAQGTGFFFLRTNLRPSKVTTAGAMFLGPHATRNRLELTAEQRDAYLQRREIHPSRSQTADLDWGQVLATFRDHTLGVALLHRSGTLESLFPRRWSGCGSA